ncbi:MAG: C40 family peptidase [Chthonomonadales bacterium]|nr:C40 family peptidase [Chthonomonadales bacterium]
MLLPVLGAMAFVLWPASVRSDEILVLDLPTPEEYRAAEAARSAPSTSRRTESLPSRGAVARSDAVRTERVVGRLGVTSVAGPIYVRPNTQGRLLARVEPGTYLAICDSRPGWLAVLMADRSLGWIPAHAVKLLDYEVVGPNGPSRPSGPNLNNPLLTAGQRTILQTAYQYLGVPYRYGGTSTTGMDCSAYVQRCFLSVGIRLPRTAREQIQCGMPVAVAQLQPADRVYFQSKDGRISHTGIYIGDGYFIHASSSRKGVAVSRLDEPMYARMYAGARR